MRFVIHFILIAALGAAALSAAPDGPRLDRHGDRLPAGAVARLGTVRFRGLLLRGPDGKSLITRRDNRATLVDPETGAELKQWAGPDPAEFEVWRILFSPNGRMVAYAGKHIELWSDAGVKLHTLLFDKEDAEVDSKDIKPVVFSRDSSVLIVEEEYADFPVSCWDTRSGERRWNYITAGHEPGDNCRVVGLGPDGNSVMVIDDRERSATVSIVALERSGLDPFAS